MRALISPELCSKLDIAQDGMYVLASPRSHGQHLARVTKQSGAPKH